MTFHIIPLIQKNLPDDIKPFDDLLNLKGKIYRQLEGRETLRVELGGEHYFIKKHFGIGWGEIFKNLLQLKLPVLGARNEWRAIKRLQSVSVLVPELFAYGERGWNPAKRESFVLMGEVSDSVSLEDFCHDWFKRPPDFETKLRLLIEVAWLVGTMHRVGINHRDCYLCHFLLKPASLDLVRPVIYLIDLHRAQYRDRVPLRWRVKDLAGLYFSSMAIGLTQRDLLRFLTAYFGLPWQRVVKQKRDLLRQVERKAHALYKKEFGKPATMKRFF